MQKIIIIALLFACAYSALVNVSVGTATGFGVTMGVAHKCHATCATCSGGLATECLSCQDATITLTSGSCACGGSTTILTGTTTPTILCEASGTNSATLAKCAAITQGWGAGHLWFDTPACTYCPDNFKTCTGAALATGCWAGVTAASNACPYLAASSHVAGMDTAFNSAVDTVNGYWYQATGHIQMPCNAGCLTCTPAATPAVLCATCVTGYTLNTLKTACECPAAGFFVTAATAAVGATVTLGACTACGTGCTTCSSATVCTVCDSSHMLGATTASSSTCETSVASVVVTTTATATTDGESSMTSTTGTDAATTNGVLITAASVLLAVILA